MATEDHRIRVATRQVADIKLPTEVEGMYDLAYNLWWSWTPQARQLFSSVDSDSWARYRNPVDLLVQVDRNHWEVLLDNDLFLSSYTSLRSTFDRYMSPERDTWFSRHFPEYRGGGIAYFSMEFGLHQSLSIYSGGLGVLSGDHCKSASDLGLPFVAVGLMYQTGYFKQAIDADGFQQHIYPDYDFNRLPIRPALDRNGRDVVVRVPMPGREVAARVWVAQVGRVPILLLDTDIVDNDPADRPIANLLYVRGRETRLVQELLLGVGGVKALRALGIETSVWHINEGHSSLLQLERIRNQMEEHSTGLEESIAVVGRNVSFTTHTPVPAGNEQFDRSLARRYMAVWGDILNCDPERLMDLGNADHGEPEQPLNLTALALRTSRFANGVSRLNAEVADGMWRHLFPGKPAEQPVIEPITNGVHLPTWLGVEMKAVLDRHLGRQWLEKLQEDGSLGDLDAIPAQDLWAAHQAQKERLVRFTRSRLREQYARHGRSPDELREVATLFDPKCLIIGFARRFATYKRARLIFSDLHRLRGILGRPGQSVQIFLAGKAHPADRPGQELIQHIYQLSQEADLRGHVVFIENYDMRVARMLVQGADVWLNTPRRPMEASGTSGQKAGINGVLNCSILDGWWPEGFDGENGWAIGGESEHAESWRQDQEDSLSLYKTLEEEVVPRFFERDADGIPQGWVRMMKRSIQGTSTRFSASRMVRDYMQWAYAPLMPAEITKEEPLGV